MTIFSIDADNTIVARLDRPSKRSDLQVFSSESQFAKLSAQWPASRFVEIWNSFAGSVPFSDLRPIRKFTDRSSAANRIWKAIQRLTPTATGTPEAKEPAQASVAPSKASEPRESKTTQLLGMLRRPNGATLDEIMDATSWQRHTVRGYISGTVGKKLGLKVISSRTEDRKRCYRIAQ